MLNVKHFMVGCRTPKEISSCLPFSFQHFKLLLLYMGVRALHLLYLVVKSDNFEGPQQTMHYQQTQPLVPVCFVAVLKWLRILVPEKMNQKKHLFLYMYV